MPKLDVEAIPASSTSDYPPPFDERVAGHRWWRRLGPLAGLTAMGASHVVLKPGAWSSQRHWHDEEDELVILLTGEAVLIEGPEGEEPTRTTLRPGDICAWSKGTGIGHHIVNESAADCSFVAISAGNPDGSGGYSDVDMIFAGEGYFHRDGTPYPAQRPA